jgi:hypothetical protein
MLNAIFSGIFMVYIYIKCYLIIFGHQIKCPVFLRNLQYHEFVINHG